jgi:hypothetical protein
MLFEDGPDHAHAVGGAFVLEPQQQYAAVRLAGAVDELAKVLIVGDEDPCVPGGLGKDIGITGLRHNLGDGQYIMTGVTQVLGDGGASRLVDEEAHDRQALCRNSQGEDILVGQRFGRVGQGSADVLWLQTGILTQDVVFWNPLGQHPYDELHRNPSSPNHRLTGHDLWIDANALPE